MGNPKTRLIIDTDPGVDDVLALLLALAAGPDELDLLLISVTYGNVDVQNCLRNVVTVFHIIQKEREWRQNMGYHVGFEVLDASKPLGKIPQSLLCRLPDGPVLLTMCPRFLGRDAVAVGAEEPLADQMMIADFFHGVDGLSGVHTSHPHLSPEETWRTLFSSANMSGAEFEASENQNLQDSYSLFRPSKKPAHEEILRILRENEPDTITIVAIGPLTNLARAAAVDTETFLRAKEVVIMGGAIDTPGNVLPSTHNPTTDYLTKVKDLQAPPFKLIKGYPSVHRKLLNVRNQVTPVAEFNVHADSVAAARVFALTSPKPSSTMPPVPQKLQGQGAEYMRSAFLDPYISKLSSQLNLTLFSLDITSQHELTENEWKSATLPLLKAGSPLAEWLNAILSVTFQKIRLLQEDSSIRVALALHDPLCIWYTMNRLSLDWQTAASNHEDIRIETSGQWTRGMCVVDRRNRKRLVNDGGTGEISGDAGSWLTEGYGNRVRRIVSGVGDTPFSTSLLNRILSRSI